MTFCENIQAAIEAAPDKETKEALQAIYDAYCGGAQTEGGGNGNGPPNEGGGND